MKKLVLLIVASSLAAADFISISLGFMELSLFRISLMLLAILIYRGVGSRVASYRNKLRWP